MKKNNIFDQTCARTNFVKNTFGQVTLGQRIKQLREEKVMLQRELASSLDIGEGFLSKVENDQKPLKREDLKKLSKLFKVPMDELETLWLGNKVYSLIRDEHNALNVLKIVEEQLTYNEK